MGLAIFNSRVRQGGGRRMGCALAAAVLAGLLVGSLTGCNLSLSERGPTIEGKVLGGQQPVSGASVVLYAAGIQGDGVGATSLIAGAAVTTDASGAFTIDENYACPSAAAQLYIVARGGNAGGGKNGALAMMAALGSCGAIKSSESFVVDEATTVAAAWALAQFMGPGAEVGSTATNGVGLSNAFGVAGNLANVNTGLAPGAGLPSGAAMETAKLNALANVLAACVQSNGGAGCSALFAAAAAAAGGVGGASTNTLDAALDIVRAPGTNVGAVFTAGAVNGPYAPALSVQPHDWTMSITYGGCASGCGGLDLPGSVAIDAEGDVWVANYFGGTVSEFSPTGAAVAANGFVGEGLQQSYGIAIDGSGDVWVTNEQSVTSAGRNPFGSVSEFNSAGVDISADGYTAGGVYFPAAVAADTNGDIWLADYGDSSATLLANSGAAISGSGGYATAQLPFTSAVAVDASHDAWFAVQGGVGRVTAAGVGTSFRCCTAPAGIAVDRAGDVWVTDYSASEVVELTSAGSVTHRTVLSGGKAEPQGIAIDGAGNAWVADYFGDSVAEVTGAAAVASPALGYGLDAPISEPYGLAIDASGSVWLSNAGASTLTQIVGIASPVKTPLLGPPGQP
jgi:streptogramin lyase